MRTHVWLVSAVLVSACGVESIDEPLSVEEVETADLEQDVKADVLNVVPLPELDVATGTHEGRVARVLTSAVSARAFLGPVLPSLSFTRNWLVVYRPDGKSPTARVAITRAQLSSTGKTLSLWATVTEPAPGCSPWRPNEVSVVRVPSRATVPTSVRVNVTRVTASCGLTVGPVCTPGAGSCPPATPFCLGASERPDGTFTQGTCVKFDRYENSSAACQNDTTCGSGICAGTSTGGGLCQPGWMRGTSSMPEAGQFSAPLPRDGSWYRLVIPVRAQASVPMDAWVQLALEGSSEQALTKVRFRVSNPSGTTSSTLAATGFTGQLMPVGVPGDESINGEWAVEVQDTGTSGAPVILRGARLSVTSRWD